MSRWWIGVILLVPLVLLVPGCLRSGPDDTASSSPSPPSPSSEATLELTGTVVFVEVEGGFHGIRGDDGHSYYPLGLDPRFRQDGMRVRFEARPVDVITTRQWGTPVKILSVSAL